MTPTDRLAAELRARLAAERKLELKQRELFEANRKLSAHAMSLSGQVIETRTEAEKARADLQRAEAHVEVVERRLWDSVETITDGFAVFDGADKLIAANTAWLSIFRFSTRIGPGTSYRDVLRCAVEEGHVLLGETAPEAWVAGMLARWGAPPPLEPVAVRTVTGAWYRFVDRRSRDGDMVCLAQDVTGLKRREAELDEARHRAEAANRAKSAFLANMSHELRTPMNGVVGMAELLLEEELGEEAELYAATIKSSGEALLQIINHVLDFSKIEAGRLEIHPRPFDLERLVHAVVTLLSPTARDKPLSLHVDYDLFLPTHLVGDEMRIRQVLINLIGNAVKFTEAGHVLVRVVGMEADVAVPGAQAGGEAAHGAGDDNEAGGGGEAGANRAVRTDGEAETGNAAGDGAGAGDAVWKRAQAWRLHVTVEDTGIGIPEDMCEHVFASFSQVESDRNRSFEGTGLGLAITRQLIELMGGEIWVTSEEQAGTCFGFSLTLEAAEPRGRSLPRNLRPFGPVLMAAQDGLDADIMERQFVQLGLDVRRARTADAALTVVADGPPPGLIVIDHAIAPEDAPGFAARISAAAARHRGGRVGVGAGGARPAARLQTSAGGRDADGGAGPRAAASALDGPRLRNAQAGERAAPDRPLAPEERGGADPYEETDARAGQGGSARPDRDLRERPLPERPLPAGPLPDGPFPDGPPCLLVCAAPQQARRAEAARDDGPIAAVLTRPFLRAEMFDALARLPAPSPEARATVNIPLPFGSARHRRADGPGDRAPPAVIATPSGSDAEQGPDPGLDQGLGARSEGGAPAAPYGSAHWPRFAPGPTFVDPPGVPSAAPPDPWPGAANDGPADLAPDMPGQDATGGPSAAPPTVARGTCAAELPDPSPGPADNEPGDPAPDVSRESASDGAPRAWGDAPRGRAPDAPPGPVSDTARRTHAGAPSGSAREAARPHMPKAGAGAADRGRPMRVLAAEDNRTNRLVLEKMLHGLAIELSFAADGQEAVDRASAERPDLIFMDISMPRMDGRAAARAIRAIEAARGAPRVAIVAMTAHALAGDREDILGAGIDGYLTKPLKRAGLLTEIRRHCPAACRSPDRAARVTAR